MSEWYRLILLALFILISLFIDLVPRFGLGAWSIGWQTSILLLGFLLIYLLGLLLLNLVSRYMPSVRADSAQSNSRQTSCAESLSWPGHFILAILLLIGFAAFFFVEQANANPVHLAILALAGVMLLLTSFTGWYEARQPPLAAHEMKLEPGAGFIQISWQPPDDLRYVECLLVRTIAPHLPGRPQDGDILYRGVFNTTWRDQVEAGESYSYVLFTHDGQERYQSTTAQTSSALPLPAPPVQLNYTAERNGIRLSWRLINPYDIHLIRLIRQAADAHEQTDDKWEKEIGHSKSWWRDGGLPSGTRFDYEIVVVDRDGQQSEPAKIRAATLAEPLSVLNARLFKRNQVALSWELPLDTPDFQDVIISRARADDKKEWEEIYEGIEKKHTDRELDYDTDYIYTIQARYLEPIRSEPKETRIVTRSRPDNVQNIQIEAKRCLIHLRWQLPEHEEIGGFKLERQAYSPTQKRVTKRELLTKPDTEYRDRDVVPGMSYTYKFSLEVKGHDSKPKEVQAKTLPPPQPVSDVEVTWTEPTGPVTLSWQLPNDETIIGTHIVRKQNKKPANHTDGDRIHPDARTQAIDRSAAPNTRYYYALFTYDNEDIYSSPVYERVSTYITLWFKYPNLKKREEVRLPTDVIMQQIANYLLNEQGVQWATITSWSAMIEETGREIAPSESLQDAGIQPNQTIHLTYETQVADDTMPNESENDEATNDSEHDNPDHIPDIDAPADDKTTEPPPDDPQPDEQERAPQETAPEPKASQAKQIDVWIRYPNRGDQLEKERLPTDLIIGKIVANLLEEQGVDVASVTKFEAIVEQTNQKIRRRETLQQAGVQSGQTIKINYTIQAATGTPDDSGASKRTDTQRQATSRSDKSTTDTNVSRAKKEPSLASKGRRIEVTICYPNKEDKKETKHLPIDFEMHQIVNDLLKEQGVNMAQVSYWMAIVEETEHELAPNESLQDAGVQPGQTINLIYIT